MNKLKETIIKMAGVKILAGAVLALAASQAAVAQPFSECPNEAFLIQDTVPKIYGVKLATGQYQLLSNNMGTDKKLNAIAFNFHDKYLYAWSSEFNNPVKIDNNYQVSQLTVTNLPNTSFYVGDISVAENIYYVYRPGYGLYAIPLDSTVPDYLEAGRIIDGNSLNLRIFDMAFHPHNGYAYSVDYLGNLHRINVNDGTSVTVSNVGEEGVFGAVYFDVDENLYISRNNDGNVFRINTTESSPLAELFAYGPSSSNNDGARCALAPVIATDAATIDFGDAPSSYGSLAEDNGARHSISNLFMGASVDAEFNSYQFPLSDDVTDGNDDEDGVSFGTGMVVGNNKVQVESSATGYVNAWVDFDGNGVFGPDEKIISAHEVAAGANTISYTVPQWAEAGNTWSRFRLSSTAEVGANGGVSDGEVEDYNVDITEPNVSVRSYPSASQWATIAFEDNWPLIGDYDFTDLVVNYRISEYLLGDQVIRVKIEGQIAAVGASFHNGFAFHLPGVDRDDIDEQSIRYTINDVPQKNSPLEDGRHQAIAIVANDVWDFVSAGENCKYHRTEPGCGSNIQMRFSMTLPMATTIATAQMPGFPYDPFLFASENSQHGYLFGQPPGRAYEIHLPNKAPTDAFRTDFFNRGEDDSQPENQRYFVNKNGMPWAINVGVEWRYPLEYMDVIYAYPLFPKFIANQGAAYADWYILDNANTNNIFSD